MYDKAFNIKADDAIIWHIGTGIAYGSVDEVVGRTQREDELGEYEVVVLRGTFICKEGSDVVYEMPSECEVIIMRE